MIIIIIELWSLVFISLRSLNLNPNSSTPTNIDFSAKSFLLPTTTGTLYNMSQDIGQRVIILDFMATWCDPCASQAKNLNTIYQNFPNLAIVSLSISATDTASILGNWSYAFRYDWTFIPYNNQTGKMITYYHVSEIGIPVTILIDKHGIVRINDLGYKSYSTIEQWVQTYYY